MRNTEVLTYYCQWGRQALLLFLQTCAFLGGGTVVLHMQHALPEHLQPQPGRGSRAVQGQNTAKTKPTRKYKTKWKTRYSWTSLAAKTYSCCTDLKTVRHHKQEKSFLQQNTPRQWSPTTITVKPSKLTAESHQFQAGHLAVYKNQNSELERAYCLVQCSKHVVGMLTGAERGKKSLGKNVLKQSRLLYPKTPQSLHTQVATVRQAREAGWECPSPSLEPLSAEHQAAQVPSSSEVEMKARFKVIVPQADGSQYSTYYSL